MFFKNSSWNFLLIANLKVPISIWAVKVCWNSLSTACRTLWSGVDFTALHRIRGKTNFWIRVFKRCLSTASLKDPLHKIYVPNARTFFCCKIFGNFTDMYRIRGNSVLNQEKVSCAGNVCQLLHWKTALKLIKFYWNTTPSMIKENNKISPLHMKKFGWKCVTCATIHPI